ncbi:MAG: hypothetical protein KDD78_21020 [Caldilineaceae bacterium]|nr:hypothetical protein [Caldilineaceae bacterium]
MHHFLVPLTSGSVPWRTWLRTILRIATFGLFFVNRRGQIAHLLRSALSCLTVALTAGLLLIGLLLWWLFSLV